MARKWDGGGKSVPARQEARKEKDRLKAEFGARLKVLLDLTGLSSREFAARFPAYKDATVRKYTLGTNLPPWDFLHDLLTEVARRTDDPAAPQRRAELFTAYRTVLVDIGADLRSSDQNSLLLRLLEGEETLHRLREELAGIRARENQLLADLEETGRADASPAARERQRRLEEETRVLAERRGELVRHRGALVTKLDDCRARLAVREEADGPGDLVPAGAGGGAGAHQAWIPSLPPASSPQPRKSRARRTLRLIGFAAAVVLLAGGGAAAGIWAAGDRGTADRAASPSPQPTTPPGQMEQTPTRALPTTDSDSQSRPSRPAASSSPEALPTEDSPTSPPEPGHDADPSTPAPRLTPTPTPRLTAPAVRWQGTLLLYSNGAPSGWWLDDRPPSRALVGDLGLECDCHPGEVDGNALAAWHGAARPTYQQCSEISGQMARRALPVQEGSMACLRTVDGRLGYFTVTGIMGPAELNLEATVWDRQ
ncbi:hypothetical protein ACH4PW_36935 [Streptomyces sp. NPDC017082]|uniref:hypothetical protein n=1 Tax=unclassified Streptomyces TaxID=2593676 RepID=UPI0037BDB1F3